MLITGRQLEHWHTGSMTRRSAVFILFAYYEAAANLMTNAALDSFGKIPEFKYCAVAVAVERGGMLAASAGYLGGDSLGCGAGGTPQPPDHAGVIEL